MKLERFWRRTINRKGLSLLSIPGLVLRVVSWAYRPLFLLKRSRTEDAVTLDVPTVSVGSLTVGGSGKTPLTCMLAKGLAEEGCRVGVVSSGYGRAGTDIILEPAYKVQKMSVEETSDEVMVIAHHVPEAMISVDPIKARGAERLAESGEVDVILIDDGFQHFALKPDIHLVAWDAGVKQRLLKLFPAGVLREPMQSLERADIIVITRANFSKDISRLKETITEVNPSADLYQAGFAASVITIGEQEVSAKFLEDKSVLLFAGVGNFRALKRQVKAMSGDLDAALELSDHQVYTPKLLRRIRKLAEKHDSDLILTTAKDMVKIGEYDFGRDIGYLDLVIDMDPGEEKLVKSLIHKLQLQVEPR